MFQGGLGYSVRLHSALHHLVITAVPESFEVLWTDLAQPFDTLLGGFSGLVKCSWRWSDIDSRVMRGDRGDYLIMQRKMNCVV